MSCPTSFGFAWNGAFFLNPTGRSSNFSLGSKGPLINDFPPNPNEWGWHFFWPSGAPSGVEIYFSVFCYKIDPAPRTLAYIERGSAWEDRAVMKSIVENAPSPVTPDGSARSLSSGRAERGPGGAARPQALGGPLPKRPFSVRVLLPKMPRPPRKPGV